MRCHGEADIRYLGSCCGAGPEHVRAMAEAMGKQGSRVPEGTSC